MLLVFMIVILGSLTGFVVHSFLSEKQHQKTAEQQDTSELLLLSPLEITLLKNNSGTDVIYGKLKIQLSLQISVKEAKDHLLTCSAKYMDIANELLSRKKAEDFQDPNPGFLMEKQLKLKQELLVALNALSPAQSIEAVFFNEFFISET